MLAAGLQVSACTALPEWADPGGWLEEKTPPPSRISAARDVAQAQAGDFPNLASVPENPRIAMPAKQRTAIAAGLTADRSNAQYSGQRLVAGGAAPENAPALPAVARNLVAPGAPAAAANLPAFELPSGQSAGQATRNSQIAPAATPAPSLAPIFNSTQASPAPAVAQLAAPADAGIPAPAVPQAMPPWRSELAGIIYFAHGSDVLNAADRTILRDIVAISRERGAKIRVIGHASARTSTVDPIEHRMANLEMSQRRADSVAAALFSLGAARDRVRTEAHADAQPVYHEFMPTGEAGNRRAEIFLEY